MNKSLLLTALFVASMAGCSSTPMQLTETQAPTTPLIIEQNGIQKEIVSFRSVPISDEMVITLPSYINEDSKLCWDHIQEVSTEFKDAKATLNSLKISTICDEYTIEDGKPVAKTFIGFESITVDGESIIVERPIRNTDS